MLCSKLVVGRQDLVERNMMPNVRTRLAIVDSRFDTARAFKLGFAADISMEENIRQFASRFV